eukprot:scaffold1400_cov175-Amphora_coffeaeformis.AAC.7
MPKPKGKKKIPVLSVPLFDEDDEKEAKTAEEERETAKKVNVSSSSRKMVSTGTTWTTRRRRLLGGCTDGRKDWYETTCRGTIDWCTNGMNPLGAINGGPRATRMQLFDIVLDGVVRSIDAVHFIDLVVSYDLVQ